MVEGVVTLLKHYSLVFSASYVLFGIFPFHANFPFFQISYYSFTMIFVSDSSSCFTIVVSMREVSYMRYAPHAWDPRSL